MKVAIYARVSTKDKHQSVENQIDELSIFCKKRDWDDIVVFHEEESGRTDKRYMFQAMMDLAFQRKIDVVVVWKLDRFARSLKDFVHNLNRLDSYGVRFIATTQGIDTDQKSPTGRLIMSILAAVAEFESDLTSERVRIGMERAKRKGIKLGRKRRIFDHQKAHEMRSTGASWSQIASACGVSAGTVRRVCADLPKWSLQDGHWRLENKGTEEDKKG